ncbi:predicted protein [Chaetomium globosum CBS 148.51]|uniref:Uncharacterized protein n=1 Tax=Chaetomium globosum (strain ATCC 6205 / CBS 148.51 / DSM 1962 / NBRC 6347 / NRRL 1970) TaxID=306901 RepID=Q2GV05_CHAGB|nr:uncharacterized protein CHGG_08199 [Chaetomium globosum CBS 148.51]EAQ86946.1 predicted protein [Chaetomium globosum CBS 148.51]
MSSRTTANGQLPSGVSANSSTGRPQTAQGAQPQSTARQPTLMQTGTSGRPAPDPTTSSSTSASQGPSNADNRSTASAAATEARPPSRPSTASTASTMVRHSSFMPKERAAKLSGEGENRARQAAIFQDALNKYKGSIDAEAKAKAAYAAHGKRVENDPCMMGRDWHSAGLEAAELANTWEKAANSARFLHEALRRATE